MSARTLPPVVPAATLRIYQPVEAFAQALRPQLVAAALRADADRRAEQAQRLLSWRGLRGRTGLPAGWQGAQLRVLRPADGRGGPLVCPLDADAGGRQRCELVRPWQLPADWLSLARGGERRDGTAGCYLIPMGVARGRAARTLRTLRTALGDADLTVEVERLARWLETFHPRSCVELDTAAVAALVGGDDGLDDVLLGLEGLAEGDTTAAAAAYRRLRRRSRILEQRARAS